MAPTPTHPGAVGVIEWLNGKRKAFTTRDGSVEAAPVRTDGLGAVTDVGFLLRATPLGEMTRTIVSGRVDPP